MQFRRILPAAAVAALAACRPSIPERQNPTAVTYAVFDPNAAEIPLPNVLAFQPQALAALPPGAQKELVQAFAVAGGFPDDQEIPATIDFVRSNIQPDGSVVNGAPDLDLTSIRPGTILALESCPAVAGRPTPSPDCATGRSAAR
jgi:hypothetical protein